MLEKGALEGKVIIITGGGTGLGKSMGEYLSLKGAKLILFSRKEEVLSKTAAEIQSKTGVEVGWFAGDVRKYQDVEACLDYSLKKFGEVNGLLNNAAGNFISRTEDLSHKAFEVVTQIVLNGTFNCSHCIGKYWLENKIPGVILNISTTYAETGSAFVVPSACAKAGVSAMTKSLAAEWGDRGLRINAVAPGPFPTEGAWSRLFPKEVEKFIDPLARIPIKRFGKHEELAYLAGFLFSDFSSYINGEVITIDAGEWQFNAGQFSYLKNIPKEVWDELNARKNR